MNRLDIVMIGAGLYQCGKGTPGYGTVLPAIFEWKSLNKNIGDVHCVSTSVESTQELKDIVWEPYTLFIIAKIHFFNYCKCVGLKS